MVRPLNSYQPRGIKYATDFILDAELGFFLIICHSWVFFMSFALFSNELIYYSFLILSSKSLSFSITTISSQLEACLFAF